MYYYISPSPNDLVHHGVLGMKWGVRRYQNKDGSLTAAGKKHYRSSNPKNGKGSHPSIETSEVTGEKYRYNFDTDQDEVYTYKETTKTMKNKVSESTKRKKALDDMALKEDYDQAEKEFGHILQDFHDALREKGEEKAFSKLHESLKDLSYDFMVERSKEIDNGKEETDYLLNIYGDTGVYFTSFNNGEFDYDELYWLE